MKNLSHQIFNENKKFLLNKNIIKNNFQLYIILTF